MGNLQPQHQKEGDFNYFNSGGPKIIEIGPISIISIIEMVGNLHPQHQKEGDFNYFNSGGPKIIEIIEIIEIPAILTWLQPNPPPDFNN